jgi:predicted kinase
MTSPASPPTAHLIHGYLAVGKTTFARRLSSRSGAILLSVDDWYLRLYTDGRPTGHLDHDLYLRLESQLDELWPQLLARGLDVVLDFGF